MSTNEPLVSVVIPTLNRTTMLTRAIDSVCQQTYKNIEIIVIDDCSDAPVKLDNLSSKTPIHISRNEKRLGGGASRNKGAKLAKGQYIAFLDDDDHYLTDKIEFLLAKLLAQPNLVAVFGHVKGSGNKPKHLVDNTYINSFHAIGGLHTNGSLIKKRAFDDIMFLETLPKYQDTQLHMELIKTNKTKYFEHTVALWNKDHGEGQITDLKSVKQHIKGLKAFYLLEEYINSKYKLLYSEYLYLMKNKVYLLSKCKKKDLVKNNISYTWYESILLFIAGMYVKFKR
ncbi:glycosyltransferase family 2 protein [Pseudoalteromonas sp. MMG007]|uniref:glycosyltransferase family 2 protein n=1 Tax=Pseudoalteromonas sp. MMG007 TaxID=2822684 RepID=UPI001B39A02D|nr:glycosyltransferase family 2 protein [Pseudoalteromonas sp. MMG007]MBQ4858412.1 glycosyltransferase family 2 protein [Pseudoalteromonas sp. MMG007]